MCRNTDSTDKRPFDTIRNQTCRAGTLGWNSTEEREAMPSDDSPANLPCRKAFSQNLTTEMKSLCAFTFRILCENEHIENKMVSKELSHNSAIFGNRKGEIDSCTPVNAFLFLSNSVRKQKHRKRHVSNELSSNSAIWNP